MEQEGGVWEVSGPVDDGVCLLPTVCLVIGHVAGYATMARRKLDPTWQVESR